MLARAAARRQTGPMQTISPFLWFDSGAEEAAELYVSLFENSGIDGVTRLPDGGVFVVSFTLDGVQFHGMNGGPSRAFSEAISFSVSAPTQERIDQLWGALIADGGEPSQCGWLKDRFGLSWQIVPPRLNELLAGEDAEASGRVMQAMMGMQKFVIADLEAASAG
jgi:predicted 3-demethylubiquinone-9 3-methyltransferase (glyoxalase superfamily)